MVVGVGFAGLATVRRLTHAGMRVTLVDRNIYSTFQPLLYQVATGGLNPSDVAYPVRGFAHRFGALFVRGELVHIDDAARQITLADGEKLDYDYLVIGTGVTAAFYGVTGADKHSYALYTRRDAVALRDHILAGLELLSGEGRGRRWRSRWWAAARPAWRRPGPWPSCATSRSPPRIPTSTGP